MCVCVYSVDFIVKFTMCQGKLIHLTSHGGTEGEKINSSSHSQPQR